MAPAPAALGRVVVLLVSAGALACAGVVSYGVLRYPGLLNGSGTWATLGFFAAVLGGLVVVTALIMRRRVAGRLGLAGGLTVAAVWASVGVVVVGDASRPAFALLLLALPLAALAVGAVAAWTGRDFPSSGLPDLATYEVSDNLGTAMALLLLVTTVNVGVGCAGGHAHRGCPPTHGAPLNVKGTPQERPTHALHRTT